MRYTRCLLALTSAFSLVARGLPVTSSTKPCPLCRLLASSFHTSGRYRRRSTWRCITAKRSSRRRLSTHIGDRSQTHVSYRFSISPSWLFTFAQRRRCRLRQSHETTREG